MDLETIDPQCLFAATNYPTPTSEHAPTPPVPDTAEDTFEFWIAPGDDAANNSIWYRPQLSVGPDGTPTWGTATTCERNGASGVEVALGSSPCTVKYRGRLHLFYHGSGRSGTLYTVYDSATCRWSELQSVTSHIDQTISRCTSPSVVVYQGRIYLFWIGPMKGRKMGANGIWYSTFDGAHWNQAEYCADSGAQGIEVAHYTSPAAHANHDGLYLFFTAANHTIHYTKSAAMMDHVIYWDRLASLGQYFGGGLSLLQHTSPSVLVGRNSDKTPWRSEFLIMWTSDGSYDRHGVHYALFANERWSPPRLLDADISLARESKYNGDSVAALLADMSRLFMSSKSKIGASPGAFENQGLYAYKSESLKRLSSDHI